ncbi:MAG: molybdopterin-dependent oxidoreductase [Spirochaetes bacterium]|nr:molybdopterin-dependent oxidoreductase [Spirochaetota bacterium]
MKTLPVSCNKDCGGGCPLLAHVEDGRLVKITNNPHKNRYMTGCVRGYGMTHVVYSEDRLTRPLLRTGPRGSGRFKEASWDEALGLVAGKLGAMRDTYGAGAVFPLGGSGGCVGAVHNTAYLKDRFFGLFGPYTRAHGDYSENAVEYVKPFLFGSAPTGLDPGTLQFSNFILLWGMNIYDNRFGCETLARVGEAIKRGIPVIVIDPRRTATASRFGTEWIPVLPGTDSALMAAVLFVLIEENLVDRTAVQRLSHGFDHLERYIMGESDGRPKTPSWAEKICGVPSRTIRSLARLYGFVKPAALFPGLSIQRTWGGEETARFAVALQVATGNVGVQGGSTGGNVLNKLPRPVCGTIELRRSHGGPSIPVYRWPDAVLEGKKGGFPSDIRLLYFIGCNYLVQGSDVHKNIRALEKADFSVCHDYFLTPTARYCDVVLPVTTFLEREDIVFPRSNRLFYSHQAVEPRYDSKNDYDVFCGLAARLGFYDRFSENRSADGWLLHILENSEVRDVERFKETGIFEGNGHLRTGLSEFAADPERNPLDTPSGKIELYSESYAAAGFSPVAECRVLPEDGEYPLRLITPHPRLRTHSQYHNISWFRDRQENVLSIHPSDAERRGIHNGDEVLVRSREGRMRVRILVTEDILPGVVSAYEGVWPVFDDDGTETAGSVNVLTSTVPTEPSMGSRTHSVFVEVSPFDGGKNVC